MRRFLPLAVIVMLTFVPRAEAITIRDIVDLSRAGMGEEILLALIEVDGGIFRIDTETLTMLKREGVSERVILAMVKSGRTRPAAEPAAPPDDIVQMPAPPPVVVIEHQDREVPVPVPVPVYVPVYPRYNRYGFDRRVDYVDRDFLDRDPATGRLEPARPAEPVYWGFGGKLRPDAWQPAPRKKDR